MSTLNAHERQLLIDGLGALHQALAPQPSAAYDHGRRGLSRRLRETLGLAKQISGAEVTVSHASQDAVANPCEDHRGLQDDRAGGDLGGAFPIVPTMASGRVADDGERADELPQAAHPAFRITGKTALPLGGTVAQHGDHLPQSGDAVGGADDGFEDFLNGLHSVRPRVAGVPDGGKAIGGDPGFLDQFGRPATWTACLLVNLPRGVIDPLHEALVVEVNPVLVVGLSQQTLQCRGEAGTGSHEKIHHVETHRGAVPGLAQHAADTATITAGIQAEGQRDSVGDTIGVAYRAAPEVVHGGSQEIQNESFEVVRESDGDAERLSQPGPHAQGNESISHDGSVSAPTPT